MHWLRYTMGAAILAAGCLTMAAVAAEQAVAEEPNQVAARHDVVAEKFEIAPVDSPSEPLELLPAPLLTYTNPVRARGQQGAIYLWTRRGRPFVVGSVWSIRDRRDADSRQLSVELHSLSEEPLYMDAIEMDRRPLPKWRPPAPGVEMRPLPRGATSPTTDALLVRRRIAQTARRFEAAVEDRKTGQSSSLRLLPQPLYRYGGDQLLAGALFAFVLGTDPEAFLLIEARRNHDGGAMLHYGFARMTGKPLTATFEQTPVWEAEQAEIWAGEHPYYFCVNAASFAANTPGEPDAETD